MLAQGLLGGLEAKEVLGLHLATLHIGVTTIEHRAVVADEGEGKDLIRALLRDEGQIQREIGRDAVACPQRIGVQRARQRVVYLRPWDEAPSAA